MAQAGVMRMLFLEQPLPQAAVTLWVKKEHSKWVLGGGGTLGGLGGSLRVLGWVWEWWGGALGNTWRCSGQGL